MILILDNRDSFVFNLDQAFRALGAPTLVLRTDRCAAREVLAHPADALVLSPGPGVPAQAGCLLDVVRGWPLEPPILGVCLGHQALAEADGAPITRAPEVVHGRCSTIRHDNSELFRGVANPFEACRYHSWIVEPVGLPRGWRPSAWTIEDGLLMAMRHDHLPRFGVQFHPESFRTASGLRMLANFLALVRARVHS